MNFIRTIEGLYLNLDQVASYEERSDREGRDVFNLRLTDGRQYQTHTDPGAQFMYFIPASGWEVLRIMNNGGDPFDYYASDIIAWGIDNYEFSHPIVVEGNSPTEDYALRKVGGQQVFMPFVDGEFDTDGDWLRFMQRREARSKG